MPSLASFSWNVLTVFPNLPSFCSHGAEVVRKVSPLSPEDPGVKVVRYYSSWRPRPSQTFHVAVYMVELIEKSSFGDCRGGLSASRLPASCPSCLEFGVKHNQGRCANQMLSLGKTESTCCGLLCMPASCWMFPNLGPCDQAMALNEKHILSSCVDAVKKCHSRNLCVSLWKACSPAVRCFAVYLATVSIKSCWYLFNALCCQAPLPSVCDYTD